MPTKPTVDEVRELLDMLNRPEDALDIGAYYARVFAFLCRHFLASREPMMAGEFAGLVIAKASSLNWFNERYVVEIVAAEHNITIVEPKK